MRTTAASLRTPVGAALVWVLTIAGPVLGQQPAIEIALAKDTERERQTRAQLERLIQMHDVERWLFTRTIRIDETQIPHSHPVLTLHARHLGDDLALLATFVHEQFHWFVAERDSAEARAMAELRAAFPDVPQGGPEGARDEYSTYLHLIVCDLEFQAMTQLVGEERARETLARTTHYLWIYRTVLNDPRVREINRRHGFIAAPPAAGR